MTITPLSTQQTDTHCNICGHPSHCGGDAIMSVKDYDCDGGTVREVSICKHCNCENCKRVDIGLNKKEKVIPNNKNLKGDEHVTYRNN